MLGRNMVAWFADMGEACALPPEISAFLIDREPLLPCRVSLRPPPAGLTWLKPCMAASPCQSSQIFPAIPFTVSRSILCEAWDYFRAHLDMRHYAPPPRHRHPAPRFAVLMVYKELIPNVVSTVELGIAFSPGWFIRYTTRNAIDSNNPCRYTAVNL